MYFLLTDFTEAINLIKTNICKVCWCKEAIYVMIPCGHLSLCLDCVSTQIKCVICRKKANSIIKIFKS